MPKRIFYTFLFLIQCQILFSQQLKFAQGVNISDFIYRDQKGDKVEGLKSGTGLSFQLALHKGKLVESEKYQIEQTPFAIYLNNHDSMAKFLSAINYDIGLQFNQINAFGDIQNNPFSYRTSYVGLFYKLGFRIPLVWKINLNIQGIASANKIVQGNQFLLNQYVNITTDEQFSQVKIFGGYGVELEKILSDRLSGYISFANNNTLFNNSVSKSTLNFDTTVINFGIRLKN